MTDISQAEKGGIQEPENPPFFIFGGWCPHLTYLVHAAEGRFEYESNFEDIEPKERVLVSGESCGGMVNELSCGIPEQFFAHAVIEWDQNGLFIIKCQITYDFEKKEDASSALDPQDITTICQNIIYKIIKDKHHIHTHHDEEEDNLLSLLNLGKASDSTEKTFQTNGLRTGIIKHIYRQYSWDKPDDYTTTVKTLLGDQKLSQAQLEVAIKILYQGIGETTFGMAFLGMNGNEMYTDAQLNKELIKMESFMKTLETLKGRYTFEYMKKGQSSVTAEVAKSVVGVFVPGSSEALS